MAAAKPASQDRLAERLMQERKKAEKLLSQKIDRLRALRVAKEAAERLEAASLAAAKTGGSAKN